MTDTDEALMLEFSRGSRAAFDELYTRYREPLFGFFRRRLESRECADDLAQETFLAVIRGAKRYEPRASFRTYLYAIAIRLLAAERRAIGKAMAEISSDVHPGVDPTCDASIWVRQALGKLDEDEREILMLREYEQLNYSEIAELMSVPVNTVRSRLFRSRMAVKSHLNPAERMQDARD